MCFELLCILIIACFFIIIIIIVVFLVFFFFFFFLLLISIRSLHRTSSMLGYTTLLIHLLPFHAAHPPVSWTTSSFSTSTPSPPTPSLRQHLAVASHLVNGIHTS